MIDINLIRKTPDVVRENMKKKFQDSKLHLVDDDRAGCRSLLPHYKFKECTFAGAGSTDNKYKFSVFYSEINIFKSIMFTVVGFGYSAEFYHKVILVYNNT